MFKKHSSTRNLILFFVIFSVWIVASCALMVRSQDSDKYERLYPSTDGQGRGTRVINANYAAIAPTGTGAPMVIVHTGANNESYFVPLASTPEWNSFLAAADNGFIPVIYTPYVPEPFCGDGVCNGSEDSYGCPSECEAPQCLFDNECYDGFPRAYTYCENPQYMCQYDSYMTECYPVMDNPCLDGECVVPTSFGSCRSQRPIVWW